MGARGHALRVRQLVIGTQELPTGKKAEEEGKRREGGPERGSRPRQQGPCAEHPAPRAWAGGAVGQACRGLSTPPPTSCICSGSSPCCSGDHLPARIGNISTPKSPTQHPLGKVAKSVNGMVVAHPALCACTKTPARRQDPAEPPRSPLPVSCTG